MTFDLQYPIYRLVPVQHKVKRFSQSSNFILQCFRQEMEEIRREILSLSEKYSIKCVESAALEERLATATAQLAQAHNHIMQLDARYNST